MRTLTTNCSFTSCQIWSLLRRPNAALAASSHALAVGHIIHHFWTGKSSFLLLLSCWLKHHCIIRCHLKSTLAVTMTDDERDLFGIGSGGTVPCSITMMTFALLICYFLHSRRWVWPPFLGLFLCRAACSCSLIMALSRVRRRQRHV